MGDTAAGGPIFSTAGGDVKTRLDHLSELRSVLGDAACIVPIPRIGMLGCKRSLFDETYYVVAGDEESLIRFARDKKTCGGCVVKLDWIEQVDDDDNVYWEAASPYHVDGTPIRFRLRQRLHANRIVWCECHDAEIAVDERHETLADAKWACEEEADNIMANVLSA